MKALLLPIVTIALFTACEQRIETPAGGEKTVEKDTTIVNPPGGSDKKSETNTTIVNPAAPAASTESSSTTTTTH